MNYPGNQMEFENIFKTEQDCINYIVTIRWPHDFECPVCGFIQYRAKNKGRFERRDCHAETTVTNGTIFINQLNLYWFGFGQYGGWLLGTHQSYLNKN